MGKQFSTLLSAALVAALCGTASAYTLSGTVTDKDGKAIQGADVKLIKKNKSTTTDAQGKFTFKEETIGLTQARSAGGFSVTNGVLNFTQNGSNPVQVKIFDMVGNQVFAQTFQGSGAVDLNSVIEAQGTGTYLARVKLGSAQETIRFNASGNFSGSAVQGHKALARLSNDKDTLSVAFEGFDTYKTYLPNLDTTVSIKLTEAGSSSGEETFAFGYALKNTPRPSKGCGKNSSINSIGSVENGQKFQINVGGKNRIFFLTLPKNYDNSKPHKVLIANHCMGSKAEDFVHHSPDYDHPTPYYGQQNLDKNGDYIFAAPQGNDNGTWNGQEDHDFVNQMITTIQDNYCVDTTRVFATGFSFGAMFTNSLAQHMQDRLRAVAVYATADYNIWLPSNTGKPIAWMGVHGKNDQMCSYDRAKTSALPRILKNNGKPGADGKFTDASSEKPTEVNGNTGHVCYDFKTVDERFPVKWCSWPGGHQWTAHDNGSMNVGAGWQETWVPEEVHKFFEQF